MSLGKVEYLSLSYVVGALLLIVGIVVPLTHMATKNRRPILRGLRRD